MLKFDSDLKNFQVENKITTGFNDFDPFLENIKSKDSIITVGGRPSMGKTSFALSICNYLLKEKHKVLYASLDYSKDEIEKRFIENKIKMRIEKKLSLLVNNAIDFYDKSGLSILAQTNLDIEKLEEIIKETKPEFLFIDYVQLLKMPKAPNLTEATNLAIYEIKRIARENNLCVFLLSQLSRNPEYRTDKRPILSDLRNGSLLEELSDVVIMIYRNGYYNMNNKNLAEEIIIRKNNSGPIGNFFLNFKDGFFENIDNLGNL
ncbi:AAA family ATPase [bacterium]|nr:AAA family ATPase [bacterium]